MLSKVPGLPLTPTSLGLHAVPPTIRAPMILAGRLCLEQWKHLGQPICIQPHVAPRNPPPSTLLRNKAALGLNNGKPGCRPVTKLPLHNRRLLGTSFFPNRTGANSGPMTAALCKAVYGSTTADGLCI